MNILQKIKANLPTTKAYRRGRFDGEQASRDWPNNFVSWLAIYKFCKSANIEEITIEAKDFDVIASLLPTPPNYVGVDVDKNTLYMRGIIVKKKKCKK